jgi:SAM-dependent methyltransferase
MTDYSHEFYADLQNTALPSARRIVPLLMDWFQPRSVLDVGCGDGSWLSVFREHGIEDIFGIDGFWVNEQQLRIPRTQFRRAEIDKSLGVDRPFDMAMTLEVAEHLPEARAAAFVSELTASAPVVLFSAAIPFQGGLHHVNERWPDYWAALFAAHGFRAADVIRWRVWNDPAVTWWYKQNILLFVRDDVVANNAKLRAAMERTPAQPLPVVHPEKFLHAMKTAQPSFSRWLKMAPDAVRRSLARRRSLPDKT